MAQRYTRIFLLSHMRAFTSLAGHILGSHPAINGYYEMHLSYEDATALDRQLDAYQQHDALKANSRYLFDKLLHNDYVINLNLPELSDCKLLVSLLDPQKTLKSIVDLFSSKPTDELYASPIEAAKYYTERVQTLADFCRAHPQRAYYYDAELFKMSPERLLPAMTRWLELDTPLSERYQLFSQTGKAHKGDSSQAIQSGEIDRTPNDYAHIVLPDEVVTQVRNVYQTCRQIMIENAIEAVVI